jgi:DNA-binding MurR/RpiR family transcriptional regulator
LYKPTRTVAERLHDGFDDLTRAERQLANTILEEYPVSGLGSITIVARKAEVSTPTVARMVQKIGYSGYADFQAALRAELAEKVSDPIAKRKVWSETAPEGHILNRFTDAVIGNIRQSLAQIDIAAFDESCEHLADLDRKIYISGGRITRALADYFFLHMQVARPDVTHIQSVSNAWPHYLLDIKKGDVVVIFDVRRYENNALRMAEMAVERGAKILLFTDQWLSPISKCADWCFSSRIVVPSAWDSNVAGMLLLETFIADVQEKTWPVTKKRMQGLEAMFDRTRMFRKFT